MIRIFTICSVLVCMFFVFPVLSNAQVDEVLVTIPSVSATEAVRVAPSPIHFYHRLEDGYLAGTSRITTSYLKKRGIDVVVVDDQPWSESYAIVAKPHPGKADVSLDNLTGRVLLAGNDFRLVKGSESYFERLREQGFVCVEIDKWEVPIDATTTRLPENIGQHRYGLIDTLISFVSDTSIREYIQAMQNFGTRYWNNANRDSVSKWVRAKYLETGIADVKLDSFQYSSTWQANVVATIPGTVDPSKELIVGGHHDSYNSANQNLAPGADDNASGAAGAIEMARVLKLRNYQPAYTMRFMGYAAEEAGLRGSASYAQRARAANRDIRCMQNYDMIANRYQAPTDQSVYVVWYTTSEAYRDLHATMMQMYTPLIPVPTTSYRSGSDSYSFWQQNYRTVFIIERNFSPYYHSQNDLLQYLDMTYCANIVKSGLAMLVTLDQMPASVANLRVLDRGNGTSLRVSWDSVQVPDFALYRIYVGRIPGVYDTIYTQTTRSRTITGLTEGTSYIIGVSIVDLVGREGMVTELTGVPRSVPLPPAGLATEGLSGCVKLNWRKNTEMDMLGYNVYRTMVPIPGAPFMMLTSAPTLDTLWMDSLQNTGVYEYYVTAVDSQMHESAPSDTVQGSVLTGINQETEISPFAFRLYGNYPNPFNPSTGIRYEIGQSGHVEIRVFDMLGREVDILVSERKSAGSYVAMWNAREAASGVYYVQLKAEGRMASHRMVLMK